jgi:hypothetical protein
MRFKHGKKHFKQARAARADRAARAPRAAIGEDGEAWHHEATFPENFNDPKWIFIPLVQTERAWAFGVPSSKPRNSNFMAMLLCYSQISICSRCSQKVQLKADNAAAAERTSGRPLGVNQSHRNRVTMMPYFEGDNRRIHFSTVPPKSNNMFPTSLRAQLH